MKYASIFSLLLAFTWFNVCKADQYPLFNTEISLVKPLNQKLQLRDSTKKKPWKEKVSFGGNVSVNFGPQTFVLLNPQIIYKLDQKTWLSAGPFYQYQRFRFGTQVFSNSLYGATAFVRRFLNEQIFAQLEFNQFYLPTAVGQRTPQGYGMIGGGYAPSPFFSITAMYIFTNDPFNYAAFGGRPFVIRGGFNF